jgi:hypothetical protein
MKTTMLICMVVAAGGCMPGSTTDGGMNSNADLTGGGGTVDMAGDLTTPPMIPLGWEVISANIQGGNNNGFTENCDVAGATSLTITVQNTMTQQKTTVNQQCPAGMNSGAIDSLPLPDTNGPYAVFGVLDQVPKSVSQRLMVPSYPPPPLHLKIYAGGCDMPECL